MCLSRVFPTKYLTVAYLLLTLVLCLFGQAYAAQVTLAWDANNPAPDGYRLFQRTAGGTYNYNSPVWSGTALTCTIPNLANGTSYYYVVRAFDGAQVSSNSNEVTFRYDPPTTTSYTITATAGSNGSISPSGSRSVSAGGSQSYTITPGSGYRIASVQVDGSSVGAVSSYTFSAVNANHTISASFIANSTSSYTITSSAGSNGTISPLGSRSVSAGGSQSYTITPNSGYRIANVLIDGTSVGAVKSYTFSSVKANHTIKANFLSNTYTITSSAGSNGTISPVGSRSVSAGGSQSYAITPRTGYRVARVLVDGTSVGAVTSYTFSSVKANHTISASFSASTTVTALSLSSRTVLNQAPNADAGPDQSVNEGRQVTLSGLNSMDTDDGIASYRWRQIQGPAMALRDTAAAQAAFTAPDVTEAGISLTFELTVVDQSGATALDTCIVNVTRSNAAPTANAGLDQTVAAGDRIDLSATGSTDPDNGIAACRWVQIQGPAVTLSDAASPRLSFTAPAVDVQGASMIFQLTVTDSGGLRDSDTCMVTVERENAQPIAHAGADQQVKEGAETELDGSASMDPDNGIAGYVWKQIEGKPVILSDAGAANPFFTAPRVETQGETLTFQVTVKDKSGLQSVDRCQVFVRDVVPADTATTGVAPTADGISPDSAATP